MTRRFPDGFLWGAATSAYQVEGAAAEDGRRPSIWDTFCERPGAIEDGSSGAVAADHYHRFREDVELAAGLGLGAYRFSVAWPRVVPDGDGAVNEAGLDFYDRLVDSLCERGIAPAPTLYHWDLPQALEDRGGWREPATVDAYLRYVEAVARRLGDRVPIWITQNEPWVSAFWGHAVGSFAPGRTSWAEACQVGHHILLAHGRAVALLRGHGAGEVGISLSTIPARPASPAAADAAAARRATEYAVEWFLDPLFGRGYPAGLLETFAAAGAAPRIGAGEMEEIAAPIDFLGVNYYYDVTVAADPDDDSPLGYRHVHLPGPETGLGWAIDPAGLTRVLTEVWERYRPAAIYVTENGAAWEDPPPRDGLVEDPERARYLFDHFGAALDAIEAGVPLRGFFVWSLIDCFEWSMGSRRGFGIVDVDFETLTRTVKRSGRFVGEVAAANALGARP